MKFKVIIDADTKGGIQMSQYNPDAPIVINFTGEVDRSGFVKGVNMDKVYQAFEVLKSAIKER
jgi:hypothetical protein